MDRASVRAHLEVLKERFADLLADAEIRDSLGTDYAFRFFVAQATWSDVVARLASELDYDSFKREVGRHKGRSGAACEDALHDVWSVMHHLQK